MADYPVRRSPYADRFLACGNFVFADDNVFAHRGAWGGFFSSRIGPRFGGRVILEIGCNDGELLSAVATRHPEIAFVGIDWKYRALHTAATRIANARLPNVALLHGRGQAIARIFGDEELDEVWVFHPDPCDKPRELRNRLLTEPFLIDAHQVLRDAGSLVLKTDHAGYYQWVLALFGMPEPQAFADAVAGDAGRTRVRVKDVINPESLPKQSKAVKDRFCITAHSSDYWNQSPIAPEKSGRCFSDIATPFESRFMRKRWPIYYLEMTKRPPMERADARTPCP